jgi:Raf kinase inhibitor-like YbhB/YbcL family protein
MRRVVLLAVVVLVAGCAGQDPAPPPEEEAGGQTPENATENETPEPGTGEPGDTDEDTNETDEKEPAMQIRSHAFADGEPIPEEHTADGEDASPPLNLTDVPDETETLAIIVDDPDAPREDPFVHWLMWNIPGEADTIAAGYPPSGDGKAFNASRQGANDFGNERYDGPAPPKGEGPHRYRFQLFALEAQLDVDEGAQREDLENAMEGAVIAEDTLTGTYER